MRVIESARQAALPPGPIERQLQRWLQAAALYAPTPIAELEAAVGRELADLKQQAAAALHQPLQACIGAAREPSTKARLCLERLADSSLDFPVQAFRALSESAAATGYVAVSSLDQQLAIRLERHAALERRIKWLVNPERTRSQLQELDPIEDADQLWCFVKNDLRPQILHAGWANAIKRVAQNEAMSTFIHATRRAETRPLKRTEDTLYYLYFRFNWGQDSFHGRRSVEAVNQIHGRYAIAHEAMKFVLLDSAFTILDAIDVLGHRPLTQTERLGYFHATVHLGHEMNIAELSHDYDEMQSWFRNRCQSYSSFAPQKRRLWVDISDSFDSELKLGKLASQTRRTLETIAMDPSYRSSLGLNAPHQATVAAGQGLMKVLARLRAKLPVEPYVESLQPCFSYPNGVRIEQLGERSRSEQMPAVCPFSGTSIKPLPNHGYPEAQQPVVDIARAPSPAFAVVYWDEVRKHNTADDLWLVFDGHVHDVSAFAKNHPGGLHVLLAGHGRDLSEEYKRAEHTEMAQVFALNFRIARIEPPSA